MQEQHDRLSRMIARLTTQRACLDYACASVEGLVGPVLEVGLGKGRTYDRLRCIMPDRDIYVFDREIHCPDDVRPPADRILLGDFRDTLKAARIRLGRSCVLAHADIGSDDPAADQILAAEVAPLLCAMVIPGGWVLTDRAMSQNGWESIPPPVDTKSWPYFMYRVS